MQCLIVKICSSVHTEVPCKLKGVVWALTSPAEAVKTPTLRPLPLHKGNAARRDTGLLAGQLLLLVCLEKSRICQNKRSFFFIVSEAEVREQPCSETHVWSLCREHLVPPVWPRSP